jgi:hypothetical protein
MSEIMVTKHFTRNCTKPAYLLGLLCTDLLCLKNDLNLFYYYGNVKKCEIVHKKYQNSGGSGTQG